MKPSRKSINKTSGARLKLARQERSVTRRELADVLSMSQQQLWKYETGRSMIKACDLKIAADYLTMPLPWFFFPTIDRATRQSHAR